MNKVKIQLVIFLISILVVPISVLAINNIFFAGITTFSLLTSDTAAATTLIVDEITYPGNQVTSLDVQSNYIRVTLDDNTSTIRFDQPNPGHYIYVTVFSGTGQSITPTCPTTNVQLTGGTSGTVVLDVDIRTTAPSCPGGGRGHIFPSNYSVSLNSDQACTETTNVTLNLAVQNASQVLISNNDNFLGDLWQTFDTSLADLSWQLSPGDGIKTVYVLYRSSGGNLSNLVSDSIELKTLGCAPLPPIVPEPPTEPAGPGVPVEPVSGLQFGDLIKGSLDTVYYYASDGKRHVFPTTKTYFSWYEDFSGVKIISDSLLAKIQINTNVTYRPGVKMLKIESDPKVYAVDAHGTLRWITTEELVIELYGENWGVLVEDLSVAFFIDYTIGESILNSNAFNPNLVTSQAVSINFDKALSGTAFIPNVPEEKNQSSCSTLRVFTQFLGIEAEDNEVRELQKLLQCLGYFPQSQDLTGYFGPLTEEAVKKFQADNSIEAVGYVGPATRAALNKFH